MLYESQIVSKYWYHNTRYLKLCDKLNELREKRINSGYTGIETRRHKKMRLLERKVKLYGNLRSMRLRSILKKQFPNAMKPDPDMREAIEVLKSRV
jgi:hypothetical protein